ncbi:MAG: GDP-mannose 4,6-dehydratase [Methanobacterium sp.]
MNHYTYLLIGGNGFIGTNIIYELLKKERDVYCIDMYDSNTKNINDKHFKSYMDDLSDKDLLKELVEKSDIIIYLATTSNVRKSSEETIIEIDNIDSFINTLEIIKNYPGKKVILASSGGTVYGEPEKVPVSEENCLMPISPHGIGKVTIESFLKYYSNKYGIKYVICRYSNPYGRFQNPSSGVGVINKLLHDYQMGEETKIISNPEAIIRDYIYISDLVDATITVAEDNRADNNVFNVGSGIGHSLTDIINEIEEVQDAKMNIKYEDFGVENVSSIVLDVSKIKHLLGWTPKVTLKKGLILHKEWIEDNFKK